MTILAWDGTMLAADKGAYNNGVLLNTVTKIYRIPGGLLGLDGDGDCALDLLAWFRTDRDPSKYPECQKGESRAGAVFIDTKRRIWQFDKSPNPQLNEQKQFASGHGRDFALAAMYLGHDAKRAVEVACHFDVYCGNGIDTLTLVDE